MLESPFEPVQADKYNKRIDEDRIGNHGHEVQNNLEIFQLHIHHCEGITNLLISFHLINVDPVDKSASGPSSFHKTGYSRVKAALGGSTAGEEQGIDIGQAAGRKQQD